MVAEHNEPVTRRECDIKHESVKENNDAVWKKLNAIDVRVWLLLVGVFGNLVGIILFFINFKKG